MKIDLQVGDVFQTKATSHAWIGPKYLLLDKCPIEPKYGNFESAFALDLDKCECFRFAIASDSTQLTMGYELTVWSMSGKMKIYTSEML